MNSFYGWGARFYDAVSGEWPVYHRGRIAGVGLMNLREGDSVLDVGCGTGLNFSLLLDAVGATGHVIGLDQSASMLAVAQRRIAAGGWSNVTTVRADATDFSAAALPVGQVNAVFASYALSVVRGWPAAWECMRAVLRPGGRAGIVDMQLPTGAATIFGPLARLACALGGSDIHARPWRVLRASGRDYREVSVRGGHIVAATATIP